MRPSRTVLAVGVLAAIGVLLLGAGTAVGDVFSNIGPASQVTGGLFGAFPLGNYALDSHFSAVSVGVFSGVDVSGVPPMIAFFLANTIWQLTAFLANSLITVFTWAFSLNLLTGSAQTNGAGALGPVSAAMQSIYSSVFGQPWLVVAIVLAGVWAMWKALVQRRYTETAGALAISVIYVLVALLIVTQPQRTIGTASQWTNEMSAAFLSLTDHGTLDSEQQAKQADADQLFKTLVYEPWVVLEFGGIEHCTQTATSTSVPVQPLPAAASQQLLAGTEIQIGERTCINDANKYAAHLLRYPPTSSDRNSEYEALKDGDRSKLPSSDPTTKASYQLGPADEPAAAAMGRGGQYQRLLLSLVILIGELGAFLLLGALSAGVVLAQIVVLVLLAFAPIVLVIAVLPGRGHALFTGWVQRLLSFLVRKAIYSLILAVLLAVSSALVNATASLGWLLSFGLEAAFFWTVFLYRHHLTGQLSAAATGHDPHHEPAADLAALYLAQRLWRGARGHGGPPPPPPPAGSGSAGPDPTPPAGGPAAPIAEPHPPQPPSPAEPIDDERPALEARPVAQPDHQPPPAQLSERPRLALPAPSPTDEPERDDAPTESSLPSPARRSAPDSPAPPVAPPSRPPGRPVEPGTTAAVLPERTALADPNDQSDLRAPSGADADSDAVVGVERESSRMADQEPSLADQLRADAERQAGRQPTPTPVQIESEPPQKDRS